VRRAFGRARLHAAFAGSTWAGYFSGDFEVTGTINAGTKDFKIDHPLTNLFTPTSDGIFRITGFQECTATSSGGTFFSMNFFWTLPTGGTGANQIGGPDCSNLDGSAGSFVAHAKGGTTIQYDYIGMNAPFQTIILIEQLL
jgi:hypothetical protein